MAMDGEQKTTTDALPAEGQPSGGETSPSETTYSGEQVKVLMSERHSTLDKQVSTLTKDLKDLQLTVVTKDSDLTNVLEEKETLLSQIKELTSDDPKKFDVIKKELDITAREKNLTTAKASLETEKQAHGATVTLAETTLREININEIAAGYEGGDAVALKSAIEKFEKDFGINIKTDEQIRMAIPSTWAKKPTGTPPVVPVSTRTNGGAESTDGLSAKDKIERGIAEKQKKSTTGG